MGYAIAAFVICFLLAGSELLLLFYREQLGRRMAAILAPHPQAESRSLGFGRLAASVGLVAKSLQKTPAGRTGGIGSPATAGLLRFSRR
jgi:hypothetical protein